MRFSIVALLLVMHGCAVMEPSCEEQGGYLISTLERTEIIIDGGTGRPRKVDHYSTVCHFPLGGPLLPPRSGL